jgi:hypothetical protein
MPAGGLISTDLVRAWEQYFRQRGGAAPNVPSDVLGVVLLDDNSRGPFPGYRSFFAGRSISLVAAQFSYVGILNNENNISSGRSVVVIDWIYYRNLTAADDVIVSVSNSSAIVLANLLAVQDAAEDKDQQSSDNPLIGNVLSGTLNSATVNGTALAAGGDTIGHRLDGPWTLGPGAQLLVRPATVNEGLQVHFRGRYYPPL